MKINIEILSHKELVQRAFQKPLPNLIFISNPEYPYEVERSEEAVGRAANKLLLLFDDIESETQKGSIPQKYHLGQALDFAENLDELVVSCRVGQSRSAAIAFAIAAKRFGVEEAFKSLNPVRHSPNSRIIAHLHDLIDLPYMQEAMNMWKSGRLKEWASLLDTHKETMRRRNDARNKLKF